mmetsp:Transcript_25635/g.73709  ORF Transcript_25635/g.73709 Transcript_25635/m.73709 type:complete len:274 (+) Transcript_25635:94-915(+)
MVEASAINPSRSMVSMVEASTINPERLWNNAQTARPALLLGLLCVVGVAILACLAQEGPRAGDLQKERLRGIGLLSMTVASWLISACLTAGAEAWLALMVSELALVAAASRVLSLGGARRWLAITLFGSGASYAGKLLGWFDLVGGMAIRRLSALERAAPGSSRAGSTSFEVMAVRRLSAALARRAAADYEKEVPTEEIVRIWVTFALVMCLVSAALVMLCIAHRRCCCCCCCCRRGGGGGGEEVDFTVIVCSGRGRSLSRVAPEPTPEAEEA